LSLHLSESHKVSFSRK